MVAYTFSMPQEEPIIDRIKKSVDKHLGIRTLINQEGGVYLAEKLADYELKLQLLAQEIHLMTKAV